MTGIINSVSDTRITNQRRTKFNKKYQFNSYDGNYQRSFGHANNESASNEIQERKMQIFSASEKIAQRQRPRFSNSVVQSTRPLPKFNKFSSVKNNTQYFNFSFRKICSTISSPKFNWFLYCQKLRLDSRKSPVLTLN